MRSKESSYQPIEWLGNRVRILDQTRLPAEEVYIETADYRVVAEAIRTLRVRGAPAIGVAGAYGAALGALEIQAGTVEWLRTRLRDVLEALRATRPTAVNLPWALDRMRAAATGATVPEARAALVREAASIHAAEAGATEKLSSLGADLIEDGFRILTHCNTGPLATTGYGTALGVVLYAHEQGKQLSVLADETRPLLQGARLTCWELGKAGIPVTLITDSMAGYFMSRGKVDCVIVGADRIAANGDTANKIGTYSLAVLARENGVPFYVAAPVSTIDPSLSSGDDIPIEERSGEEVTGFREVCTAPDGCPAANPAFDITPHRYITAIITERGIIREPFAKGIGEVV